MAIVLAIPGLEVTVEVENVPLPEHQYEDEDAASDIEDDLDNSTTTKYLEAPSGAEFSVRALFSEHFDATMPVHADIYIDNTYIQAPLREDGHIGGSCWYKYAMAMSKEQGQTVTQKFRFSELVIDDEDHSTEGLRQRLRGIGTIKVYLYLAIRESKTEAPSVPRLNLSQLGPMNEKVSQKCAPEREKKTVRIKREHAEAFGQDDDKDEIEWTGTRLLRTRVFGGVIE
ncbi:hypothetical protein SLS61_006751 [Didymella pomorum]